MLGVLFTFYIQCSNLVTEKEKKLKLQMKMMGTRDTSMWLSWWVVFVLESFFCALMWVATGALFQFNLYLNTDFAVTFCFFFTLHLALAGYAAFLSTFLRSSGQVIGVGLFFFMFNWLFDGIVAYVLYTSLLPRAARNVLSVCFPPFLYALGSADLYDALGPNGKAMRWEDIGNNRLECPVYCARLCECDYTPEEDDPVNGKPFVIYPLSETMQWLVFDWLFFALIAVYFDNVVPNGYGRSQPLWYLCLPSYWGFGTAPTGGTATDVSDEGHVYDEDVLREQTRVLEGADADVDAVRIVNLCKRFGRFTAVFKINVGVKNDQLFCLLGHNGAGKTTTFNMLSGMFPPTKGDAFIFGKSVRHELRQVQGMMGICPQHDVLWSELSAAEHLALFAGLSLVEPSKIRGLVEYFLEAVDLVEPGDTPSGKYSGGMRRRLSVACALIADPSVVYLDEPTTGMDPVNRRGVWDVIEKAKKNRVVVLTTHAMEEADTLGDVVSIMSRGRLHCLGTSLHLKNKYGSGYRIDITSTEATHAEVGELIATRITSGHRRLGATQYAAEVPLANVAELQALCAAVEGGEGKRLHMDLSVSMCTLENVFIKIAHQAKDPEAIRTGARGASGGSGASGTVQVSVTCPPGKKGGDAVQIQHEGASYDLTVPDGITEGQSFQVALPSGGGGGAAAAGTALVSIACPVGSKAGDAVQIQHEGASYDLTVPDGITEGQSFQVALPSGGGGGAAATPVQSGAGIEGGTELGEDPLPDTEGLLAQHLQFRGTPFLTQFRALFAKNLTSQKRQPGVNVCVLLLTLLMMAVLILLKLLPGLIGAPEIFVCGTNVTAKDAFEAQLSIPNVKILEDVRKSLEAYSTIETCTDKDASNATEWQKMEGWVGSAMCSTSSDSADIGASNRRRMYRAFGTFGCNASLFDELEASYAYMRATGNEEEYCNVSLRPNVSVTLNGAPFQEDNVECIVAEFLFKAACSSEPTICADSATSQEEPISDLQEVKNDVNSYGCSDQANSKIEPYLQTPTPNVTAPGVADCLSSYFCLPEYIKKCGKVPVLLRATGGDYEDFPMCASGGGGGGSRRRALAESTAWSEPELEELLQQYTRSEQQGAADAAAGSAASVFAGLSGGPFARASRLSTLGAAMSRASASTRRGDGPLAQARAFVADLLGLAPAGTAHRRRADGARLMKAVREMAARRAAAEGGRRLQQLDTDAFECVTDAATYCVATEIISECPASLELMRAKSIPFTSEADTAALGALTYEPTSVASTNCLADSSCYAQLQNLAPTAQTGVLGNFSLWPQMTQTNQRLSAPNVTCAFAEAEGAAAGVCTGSLSELNEILYDVWDHANRTDIDYAPDNRWAGVDPNLEGAYETASHYSKFSLTELEFEHTVLYNGSYVGGFEQMRWYNPDAGPKWSIGALANRVHAAISRTLLGESDQGAALLSGGFESVLLKHMGFPTKNRVFTISYEAAVDFWVVPLVLSFCFPLQVMLLVSEKSQHMREVMTMSGMRRAAFWLINWLYGYFLFLCQLLVVLAVGFGNGHRIFVFHDSGLVLLFYVIFGMAITSFACFFSTLFNNKTVAGIVACCFSFLVGLYGIILGETLVSGSQLNSDKTRAASLVPIWGAMIAQRIIGDAAPTFDGTGGHVLGLGNIGAGSTTPVGSLLGMLVLDFVLYTLLCAYLDLTLPVGPGVKLPWNFFATRSYWAKPVPRDAASLAKGPAKGEAAEVSAERARVLSQVGGVRAIGLSKRYPGAAKLAVQNVQFAVKPDECFGLLGSNGAGKSTTIHMLCGVHAPSTGTVLCGDDSELDATRDMTAIQSAMGVCTQDNLLWGELTGAEHLRFFARLRRVAPGTITKQIDYWLERVNLHSRADRRKRSRAYSGGMKRRLSVANALIGNPRLVYLDEPSTGLDPESRHQLWHAVLAAKQSKCIILTTHALEEAEALCDRVGIMTLGLMRTLGTPTQLRLQFDQGYKFMLAVDDVRNEAAASDFAMGLMPGAAVRDSINGVVTFDVPKAGVVMSTLFEQMEGHKARLHIKDWGLSHTTLEEVFLKIVSDTTPTAGKSKDKAQVALHVPQVAPDSTDLEMTGSMATTEA